MSSAVTLVPNFPDLMFTAPANELTQHLISGPGLKLRIPLDNGRHEMSAQSLDKLKDLMEHMGVFKKFSREILDAILNACDLETLTTFRAVSWSARHAVDTLQSYNAVFAFSPHAIRALLATGTAKSFTAEDMYKALRSQMCFSCGFPGFLLDVLSCQRACFRCTWLCDELFNETPGAAKKNLGLTKSQVAELPTARLIPGRYYEGTQLKTTKKTVWVSLVRSSPKYSFNRANFIYNWTTRQQPPLRHTRFATSISFPHYNPRQQIFSPGLLCAACHKWGELRRKIMLSKTNCPNMPQGHAWWGTMFSPKGFVDHYYQCDASKKAKKRFLQGHGDFVGIAEAAEHCFFKGG